MSTNSLFKKNKGGITEFCFLLKCLFIFLKFNGLGVFYIFPDKGLFV